MILPYSTFHNTVSAWITERKKTDASCDAPSLLKLCLPQERVFVKKLIIFSQNGCAGIREELQEGTGQLLSLLWIQGNFIPDEILLWSHKSWPWYTSCICNRKNQHSRSPRGFAVCKEAINPHLPSFCFQRLVWGHLAREKQGFQSFCYLLWSQRTHQGWYLCCLKAAKVMRLFPMLWWFSQDGLQL